MGNEKDEHSEMDSGTFLLKKGHKIEVWDDRGFYQYIELERDTWIYYGEPIGKPPPPSGG